MQGRQQQGTGGRRPAAAAAHRWAGAAGASCRSSACMHVTMRALLPLRPSGAGRSGARAAPARWRTRMAVAGAPPLLPGCVGRLLEVVRPAHLRPPHECLRRRRAAAAAAPRAPYSPAWRLEAWLLLSSGTICEHALSPARCPVWHPLAYRGAPPAGAPAAGPQRRGQLGSDADAMQPGRHALGACRTPAPVPSPPPPPCPRPCRVACALLCGLCHPACLQGAQYQKPRKIPLRIEPKTFFGALLLHWPPPRLPRSAAVPPPRRALPPPCLAT